MTQEEVDLEIREYKAARTATHTDLRDAVRANRKGAINAARKLFGRNKVAREIGCKSKTMVTNSKVYKVIQQELRLNEPRRSVRNRSGFDGAINPASERAGDPVTEQIIANETRELVRKHLDAKEANEVIQKLDIGEMTDSQVRMFIEVHQQQKRDDCSRRVQP